MLEDPPPTRNPFPHPRAQYPEASLRRIHNKLGMLIACKCFLKALHLVSNKVVIRLSSSSGLSLRYV